MASHGVSRVGDGQPQTDQERHKEQQKIDNYKRLVDAVNKNIQSRKLDPETLRLTSKLLNWNPEYYTIWNHRRRILKQLFNQATSKPAEMDSQTTEDRDSTISSLIGEDLQFLLPLLRKFPKCYWIWNYRLWLLEQSITLLPNSTAREFWEHELSLASRMLALDNRNFHGWGYRRKVVGMLESKDLQVEAEDETSKGGSMTEQEFEYTTKMINISLSNFSAWHTRSKLIPRLLDEKQASHKERLKFLDEELDLINRALWAGENDSSLWFYHQFLMSIFDQSHISSSMAPELTREQRARYISNETYKVLEMLDGAEDCKWIYQALINLSLLHQSLTGAFDPTRDQLIEWTKLLATADPLRAGRWRDLSIRIQDLPS